MFNEQKIDYSGVDLASQVIERHGDCWLHKVPSIPSGFRPQGNSVLEHGENGNAHAVRGGSVQIMYKDEVDGTVTKYLNVKQQAELVHEEHKAIPLLVGTWKLVHEQEFDPFEEAVMRVRD